MHAPWAMALTARVRDRLGLDVETMWTNDGIVVRFPDTDAAAGGGASPPLARRRSRRSSSAQLGVHRALRGEVPRERLARAAPAPAPPRQRAPRSGSSGSARRTCSPSPRATPPSRSCSRPTGSACATCSTCRRWWARCGRLRDRSMRVTTVDTAAPSPFAASLLFGFVANYIYDGDAPLAERRAQALSIDQAQLRELLGDAELRELLDADVLAAVEAELQQLEPALPRPGHRRHPRPAAPGGRPLRRGAARPLHQRAGGLGHRRPGAGAPGGGAPRRGEPSATSRRRTPRGTATRSGSRSRRGSPRRCWSRSGTRSGTWSPATPGPTPRSPPRRSRRGSGFRSRGSSRRWRRWSGAAAWSRAPSGPAAPAASGATWTCWRSMRRRSLARARHAVEPVEPRVLGRFLTHWHGIARPRAGAGRGAGRGRAAAGVCAPGLGAGERDPPGARRALHARATSTRSSPRARWSGWASSPSASATDASRST